MLKQTMDYYNAKFGWDEEGATAVEYGLLVALIAAVIVAIVATLGTQIRTAFETVSGAIN
jgi:pilus assembly protein Flp/PilA